MAVMFSQHARDRIKTRGLLEEEVMAAITHPDKTVKLHGKLHYQKDLGRGRVEVCCKKEEKDLYVITAYWL